MTVISKFLEDNGAMTKRLPNNSSLVSVCTISSATSAIILLKLYRKSLKIRRNKSKGPSQSAPGSSNATATTTNDGGTGDKSTTGIPKKKNLNRKFFSQLAQILRILIPKWISAEIGFMSLISSMLVIRSLCDLWTIYLGTLLESSIISGERSRFSQHLGQFAMTMPLMSLTNSLLKYSTRQLEIRFRSRLTKYLMQKYMYKLTFFKLNQNMRNVDQLITTDVEKFASTAASLYSQLSKPLLDIIIYVYGITRSIGASVPSTMLGYLGISAILISGLRRPMASLTAKEQSLEGEYRFGNSRIITNSEEISFYQGGARELDWILQSFKNLYEHLDSFTAFKFVTEFFENFVARYIATVVGYFAVSRPFFQETTEGFLKNMSQDEFQLRQETYYRSGRMLVNLSQAIGKLVLNAKDLSRLAGYTSRVHDLIRTLKELNLEEDGRIKNKGSGNTSTGPNSMGRYVIQDHIIRFEDVPIITPNGDMLLEGLSMEVKSGMNVLVSGPNGCGKSSLFRILGELWPLHGGVLTKPMTEKLFYVPQKPYMPYGTFRDQIIYPDSYVDMRMKGVNDSDLLKFLRIVDLEWIIQSGGSGSGGLTPSASKSKLQSKDDEQMEMFENVWASGGEGTGGGDAGDSKDEGESETRAMGQRWQWDSKANWMDVLSGGQKQRLAMARMFYHKPQFAILDECTSAVSVDVEGTIYQYSRSSDITLFTVTHRKSLWVHHDYVLHMDGRGSYSFDKIDHSKEPDFGS